MTLVGHKNRVESSMCLLSDGRICTGSSDNTIKIWNSKTGVWEMELIISGKQLCVR